VIETEILIKQEGARKSAFFVAALLVARTPSCRVDETGFRARLFDC
jgi:hypothetical protein